MGTLIQRRELSSRDNDAFSGENARENNYSHESRLELKFPSFSRMNENLLAVGILIQAV
jgi:hypothetical protein